MTKNDCPTCGSCLKKKTGRYGVFLGCSRYPVCRYTRDMGTPQNSVDNAIDTPTNASTRVWINASSIGQVKFCPQSLYLRLAGHQSNSQAIRQMQRGNADHVRISANKHCYIASYAFSPEHPIVEALRIWRNQSLKTTSKGRMFISIYYRLSPIMIRLLGRFGGFHVVSQYLIIKLVKKLEIMP